MPGRITTPNLAGIQSALDFQTEFNTAFTVVRNGIIQTLSRHELTEKAIEKFIAEAIQEKTILSDIRETLTLKKEISSDRIAQLRALLDEEQKEDQAYADEEAEQRRRTREETEELYQQLEQFEQQTEALDEQIDLEQEKTTSLLEKLAGAALAIAELKYQQDIARTQLLERQAQLQDLLNARRIVASAPDMPPEMQQQLMPSAPEMPMELQQDLTPSAPPMRPTPSNTAKLRRKNDDRDVSDAKPKSEKTYTAVDFVHDQAQRYANDYLMGIKPTMHPLFAPALDYCDDITRDNVFHVLEQARFQYSYAMAQQSAIERSIETFNSEHDVYSRELTAHQTSLTQLQDQRSALTLRMESTSRRLDELTPQRRSIFDPPKPTDLPDR